MLDDLKVINQHDSDGALAVAAAQADQALFDAQVQNPDFDKRQINNIVITGMGGSALAALIAKSWLGPRLRVPIEVIRTYSLPHYISENTLVIASSYSGNTEETISAFGQAVERGSQLAAVSAGGKLIDTAKEGGAAYVQLPSGLQPRMGAIYNLRALVRLLVHFNLVDSSAYDEIAATASWLKSETSSWAAEVTTDKNYAKQLALLSAGKTPIFYAGSLMAPVAYKWKISWNENAKNVAFFSELPEFNHNEFIGWTSHPIEKPFEVFDLVSSLEHPQILKRFEVTDRLLSGKRPKSTAVNLEGESVIAQMLWGSILADFASIYTAILNGVNPTPVPLIEKLKQELN